MAHIWRRRPGGPCYLRDKERGILEPLGKISKARAKQILDEYHEDIARDALNLGPAAVRCTLKVSQLVDLYLDEHCAGWYVKDNRQTSTYELARKALSTLKDKYGKFPAVRFTPAELAELRKVWIEQGLSKSTIDSKVRHVRGMYKWAAARQLVPILSYAALNTLECIRVGRHGVKPGRRIQPVNWKVVDKTLADLSPPVATIIRIMRETAARPGEICQMRTVDIDRTGIEVNGERCWLYRPRSHKTEHHGRDRVILLNPECQRLLAPFILRMAPDAPLFCPREGFALAKATDGPGRRENQKPNPRRTNRRIGDEYNSHSLRNAIWRACDRLKIERWNPHQIRHTRATEIRKAMGVEAAQAVLGHAKASMTEHYARVSLELAAKAVLAE